MILLPRLPDARLLNTVLLLLVLAVAAGCERGGAGGPLVDPTGTALGEQVDPERFLSGFLEGFPDLLRQAVAQSSSRWSACRKLLAGEMEGLREPEVLAAVYAAPPLPGPFVGERGLNETGRQLLAELQGAKAHGLDPARYHVPEIEGLLDQLREAARKASAVPLPASPKLEERKAIEELVRALEPTLGRPEAERALLARVLAEESPLPGLARAFSELCALREEQELAAATVELRLADGLAHLARDLGRGNTRAVEMVVRRGQKEQEQEQQEQDTRTEGEENEPIRPGAGRARPPGAAFDGGVAVDQGQAGSPDAGVARAPGPGPDAGVAGAAFPMDAGPAAEASGAAPAEASRPGDAREPLPPPEPSLVLRDPQAYVRALLQADLRAVHDPESLRAVIEDLPPRHPQYRGLLEALQRYRSIVQAGGWEKVKPRGRLRPGKKNRTVAALKRRLAVEGFFFGKMDERFDEPLEQALRRYQETHQMQVTGRPHRQLWKSLGITAERRVQAIELSLKRWRESSIGRMAGYAFINIPDFHVEVWKDGERLLRHRIIVGENKGRKCDEETERKIYSHATPIQTAWIEFLVFSPYWNVPRSIKEQELDPERGKDPFYYEKHGYEVMRADTRREWVREMPGPANSLGFVKFIFPNPHATFLHDTPLKKLFDRPVRAFSHGCMRVQDPWKLAKLLLSLDGQWNERRFKRLYRDWKSLDFRPLQKEWDPELYERLSEKASELRRTVHLRRPVPIFVEYYPVRVDDEGRVHFLSDIYRYDEQELNPRPAKRCVPETKAARRGFSHTLDRVDALEQDAVEMVPRVLRAMELARDLDPKGPWKERYLLKQVKKLEDFGEHHENLAQRLRDDYDLVAEAIQERRGRWKKSLVAQAVRVRRLSKALAAMTREARAICKQVEEITGAGRPSPGTP